MIQLTARVIDNQRLPRDYSILTIEAPEIARSALPGQFVMAAVADSGPIPSPLLKRAMAIYTLPDERGENSLLTLLLRVVGDGTRRLASLRPDETVEIVGPLGKGFDLDRAQGKLNLLIAGGTGIASVYLPARSLIRSGEEVELIYGGRTSDDLVGLSDFEALGIPISLTTEDGSRGQRGLVTGALEARLEQLPAHLVNLFTCGPNPMMQAVAGIARQHKIPCQISVEIKMACGFGVCLGCTVKTTSNYRLACTHGPVFDAADFIWEPAPQMEVTR